MNLFFLKHKAIDKALWDEKIRNARNSRIYALSGWLDIASPNWRALVSENYDYIMPLTVKQKFGVKYLIQPKFSQQTGIFYEKEIVPEITTRFLNAVSKKYSFVAVQLNSGNKISGKNISEKPDHILNLSADFDNLRKSFSENTKRNIKKAEKLLLVTNKNISIEEAVLLKSRNNVNNLSNKDLTVLKNLISFVQNKLKVKIYGIRNEKNELISVSVFSFSNNRIYLPLIASSEEGKKKFASFQIFSTFIKDHAENDFMLDFEGSSIPGVARFFEGWGAKPESYYYYKQNNLPFFIKGLKK